MNSYNFFTKCKRLKAILIVISSDILLQLSYFLVLLVHDCSNNITNRNHTNYLLIENRNMSDMLVC
jgi:hypothetical protein